MIENNFTKIPNILKKNMSALIMEIEKYRVAEQDRISNSKQTSETGYSPNAPYNNIFGLSSYISSLDEENLLEMKNIKGEAHIVIHEPNEPLKTYPFYIHCNDDPTFNYNGKFDSKPQYNTFIFNINGMYTEPEYTGHINASVSSKYRDALDEEGIRIYIPENPNKPIFSLLYESFKVGTDAKQPQYKEVPKFLILGKPLGYVTYFLAQLFNITIDPNYEKLPEDKRPLRPNFICTPRKNYTKKELISFIANCNPKNIQRYIKDKRSKFMEEINSDIPIPNFNLSEYNLIRKFEFEDRSKLNAFDLLQEDNPKVLNQNTPENKKLRETDPKTGDHIENKKITNLNLKQLQPKKITNKDEIYNQYADSILQHTPKENLENMKNMLQQGSTNKNFRNSLFSLDYSKLIDIIPDQFFKITNIDSFINKLNLLGNIGKALTKAGITDQSVIIPYLPKDKMEELVFTSNLSVAKMTEKINEILLTLLNDVKYKKPEKIENKTPEIKEDKKETASLSSRLGIRSLFKK